MAIKFKCSCGHVLSVPDQYAGKDGKCPKCQKTVRVPTPKATSATSSAPGAPAPNAANPKAANPIAGATKPNRAQPAQAKPAQLKPAPAKGAAGGAAKPTALSAGVMDSLLDDVGLTKRAGPICKNCGADIRRGAVVCTKCGLNFESGETLTGFDAKSNRPEFDNAFLQEASDNMVRDSVMDLRRDRAAMPWWVIMSFLIGAITLCAAGIIMVDGMIGIMSEETTFLGKLQRLPVFVVLGSTASITGSAITLFAHLSITFFGFTKSVWHGLGCFFLPLLYSVPYGIMNWGENKAPVKAIMTAVLFISFGAFLIIQGGGFGLLKVLF